MSARVLLAALILVSSMLTVHSFSLKSEGVLIHLPSDYVEIYTTKNVEFKFEDVRNEGDFKVFKVKMHLSEKIALFERKISGEILEKLSTYGDIYILLGKGYAVEGDVKFVKSEDLQNVYKVVGYSDVVYRLKSVVLYGLVAAISVMLLSSFAISRVYARRVYFSYMSREEKLYKIRMLSVILPIPLALSFVTLILISNAIAAYDMVISYFFEFNLTLFAIGFTVVFLVPYFSSLIFAIFGYLPYYKRIKEEEIEVAKVVKSVAAMIAMFVAPILLLLAVMLNLRGQVEFEIALFAVFMLVLLAISPKLVSFFQRAEKLEEPLRDEIVKFCRSCGVNIADVRVIRNMPERMANAAVSGIIRKYVFLTDVLLESFSWDELKAIIAHELGHVKEKHNFIIGLLSIAVFVFWVAFFRFVEFPKLSPYMFIAVVAAVFLIYMLLLARLMVYFEFRADRFAAKMVGKDVYVRALSKLAEVNVMKRRTGKLFNLLTLHPSIEERIERLED